eukprot:925653-Pyramimonas_sp.AAC.1
MLGYMKQCNTQNSARPGTKNLLKAAEAGIMVSFCVHLLDKFGGVVGFGFAMIQAGVSLETYMRVMK